MKVDRPRFATDPLSVGGQAVIEGVMMRAPGAIATAVRRPDGSIAIERKSFKSLAARVPLLKLPIFRGAIGLVESLYIGVGSLMYSAETAIDEEEGGNASPSPAKKPADWKTKLALGGTVAVSLLLGIGFFFYLPLVLTDLTGVKSGIGFNLIDGVFRLAFFLVYIWGITRWKEMRRVFEYHGAEHKSIFAYEAGLPLTVENARGMIRFHPRCGTSFLLIVMLSSIFVFVFLGRPEDIGDRLTRLAFVPLIGGISYEAIKLSGRYGSRPWVRSFIVPGLWLQRLTTREPDDSQLEVALAALHAALGLPATEPLAAPAVARPALAAAAQAG
jgi:uncharacterized protein YqhQ